MVQKHKRKKFSIFFRHMLQVVLECFWEFLFSLIPKLPNIRTFLSEQILEFRDIFFPFERCFSSHEERKKVKSQIVISIFYHLWLNTDCSHSDPLICEKQGAFQWFMGALPSFHDAARLHSVKLCSPVIAPKIFLFCNISLKRVLQPYSAPQNYKSFLFKEFMSYFLAFSMHQELVIKFFSVWKCNRPCYYSYPIRSDCSCNVCASLWVYIP